MAERSSFTSADGTAGLWRRLARPFVLTEVVDALTLLRRTVVEATAWRFRTGSAWRDLPERFGSWNTIYKNFRRWATDGVWEDLFARVQKRASLQGEIDWVVSVDSSIARVHQHGATLSRDTGGSIELQEIRAGAA